MMLKYGSNKVIAMGGTFGSSVLKCQLFALLVFDDQGMIFPWLGILLVESQKIFSHVAGATTKVFS